MGDQIRFDTRDQLYGDIVKYLNLEKIDEEYYPRFMGNFLVTFSAGKFLIQYSMDRTQLFVYLASNWAPKQWLYLSFIRNFINQAGEINPDGGKFDLEAIRESNQFIKDNFDKIAELFDKDNYQHTFKSIDDLLKSEFIRKYPGAVEGT